MLLESLIGNFDSFKMTPVRPVAWPRSPHPVAPFLDDKQPALRVTGDYPRIFAAGDRVTCARLGGVPLFL